jgi:hypothetical protein
LVAVVLACLLLSEQWFLHASIRLVFVFAVEGGIG